MNEFIDYFGIYYLNLINIIFILYIIWDFIRDLVAYIKKDDYTLLNLFLDVLRVVIICGAIYFVLNYFYDRTFIGDGEPTALIPNRSSLKEYTIENEDIELLTQDFKDEFGVNVYINVDPNVIYGNKNHTFVCELSDEKAISSMKTIYKALAKYKDIVNWRLPNDIYIVSGINKVNSETKVAGLTSDADYIIHLNSYFAFDANYTTESTVDHEVMHVLNGYINYSDYKIFFKESDACDLVSDYACTNANEFMCETWTASLNTDLDNKYTNLMKKYYKRFLKGYKDDELQIDINDSKFIGNKAYDDLSDNEKRIFIAIDKVGNRYTNSITLHNVNNDEVAKVKTLYTGFANNDLYQDYLSITCDGQSACIRYDVPLGFDSEANELSLIVNENYLTYTEKDDYEKLIHIYRDIKKVFFSNTYEDSYYNEMIKNDPNRVLKMYMDKMGMISYFENVTTKKGNSYNAIIAEVNDNHYWLDIVGESATKYSLNHFFVDDNYYLRDRITSKQLYTCDDPTYSYFARKGLYLDKFDTNEIDNYIIRMFDNFWNRKEIIIQCSSDELTYEVNKYLNELYANDDNRFITLWRRYFTGTLTYSHTALEDNYSRTIIISDIHR